MKIRINNYIPISTVEGPGKRFVIWTQGCSLRCNGCANSHMWDKSKGKIYDTKEILELIAKYSKRIEGITFLGGEPLEQIEPVLEISKAVQKRGLSVLLFTGYSFFELENNNKFQELKKYIDVLIDGKFDVSKVDYSRAWVGSSNQNYYFFSNRYNEDIIYRYKNKLELRFDKNRSIIRLNGMGNYKKLIDLVEAIEL